MNNYKLPDFCNYVMGQSPSSQFYNSNREGLPFLQGCTTFGRMFPTFDTWTTQYTRTCKPNDVLMSVRAPVGDLNISRDVIALGRGVAALSMKQGDNRYLYYLLMANRQKLSSCSTGTIYESISKTQLENIVFDVHEPEEQRHIVDILGTLDEKIEYYDKLINSLEQNGELIFKNFIENKSLLKKHICLSDIATFYNGYSYSGDELCEQSEEALVTIKNFDRNGGFKIEGLKPIKITGKIKPTMFVELGDLLVAHTDLTQNADIIGNPIILLNLGNYKKAAISMDLVKVESCKLSKELLYYILKNSDFKAHALGYCSGTTVLHLNKKALQEYEFDLPLNDSIIEKVNNKLKTIFDRIQNAFLERQKLTELKQLYLQKFFG